jgi:hypothetical protein
MTLEVAVALVVLAPVVVIVIHRISNWLGVRNLKISYGDAGLY